ncbi:hypothetical protein SAMN05443144_10971 [Fodinibius roseus]|uniref:Uncharacterized protein n=1 Tax=Fodinibius roseus TaxID=1194090 RepID=A0A1M5C2H8_9BACT|nr:hypothetical protein SAMN05443144_10971 [Fodinibius roseus]
MEYRKVLEIWGYPDSGYREILCKTLHVII